LTPSQVKQAETQKGAADSAITARLPESYQWLLVPVQATPDAIIEWQAVRLSGQDPLRFEQAKNEERRLACPDIRRHLPQNVSGPHSALARKLCSIKQLAEDFARYLYLPRLTETRALVEAIRDGLGLLTWSTDTFAYADSFDENSVDSADCAVGSDQHFGLQPHRRLVKPTWLRPSTTQTLKTTTHTGSTVNGAAGTVQPEPTTATGEKGTPSTTPSLKPLAAKRFHGVLLLTPQELGATLRELPTK